MVEVEVEVGVKVVVEVEVVVVVEVGVEVGVVVEVEVEVGVKVVVEVGVEMNLDDEQLEVDQILGRLEHLQKSIGREKTELEKAEKEVTQTQEAQEILQFLAQAVQQQAHQKISEVVTSCLSTVFDDPYQFHIEFDRKRGRTEAKLRFIRRDLDADPLTASGGGVVDIASFALRIACLVLHRPRLSRVVVLDEPFRFLSAQYQDNIREMLEQLSKEMKLQIILVTHNERLEAGKVIEL